MLQSPFSSYFNSSDTGDRSRLLITFRHSPLEGNAIAYSPTYPIHISDMQRTRLIDPRSGVEAYVKQCLIALR
ncbi:hypothetical protein [Leptolyngbya sp. FACHB-711]|uniref:hypothetical protein n=1 Tax=unclassified Leptolyngbya TaxID=2650499 RepID=UPI001685F947|nr:hypothetical protein [Leptolyngbya sp. FACHB-711]MBD2025687.1 hypothetical protein [Leptolyngbya sp. FACHB-711]